MGRLTFSKKSAEAFAPASVSNLGCGFDILGFALESIGDRVKVSVSDIPGVRITKIHGTDKLPYDPEKNTAGKAVSELLKFTGSDRGLEIEIFKELPLGSGLGSSAASSNAAVYAANLLLENPLPKEDLLHFALEGEKIASGSKHGDNIIPGLLGGLILIDDPVTFSFIKLPYPEEFRVLIIHPDIEIQTFYGRKLLGDSVPLKTMVRQSGALGRLIAGMTRKDFSLLEGAFNDYVAEPKRSKLIPGYEEVKAAAFRNGSAGFNISGSGPAVFAVFRGEENINKAAEDMINCFQKYGISARSYFSGINSRGTTGLSVK